MKAPRGESVGPDTQRKTVGLPEVVPAEIIGASQFGGRYVWAAADQATFSVTSFALAVVVARDTSPAEFGVFGIVYIVYTLILGGVQSFTAEAFVVRGSHLSRSDQRAMLSQATGCAVCLGLSCSALSLLVGVVVGGPVGEIVPPIFVLAPFLFMQDVWRFGFFAAGRPRAALGNDLLWAALFAVGFLLLSSSARADWTHLAWTWAMAGAVCGVAGSIQSQCVPSLKGARAWVRHHAAAGGRFAGEYLALYGAAQSVTLWVGLFSGLTASAAYRGGQLLFGPVQVLLSAIPLAITPMLVRIGRQESRAAVWRAALLVGALSGTIGFGWGIGLISMPDSLGRAILGRSWAPTQPVLAPMLWTTFVLGMGLGALVLLRALQAIKQSFKVRIAGAGVILCLGAVASAHGSVAAAYAVLIGSALMSAALWWQARKVALSDDDPVGHSDGAANLRPLGAAHSGAGEEAQM